MMRGLPLEIMYEVTQWIPLLSYIALRSSTRKLHTLLEPVPTLRFSAYVESATHYNHLLFPDHRIRLAREDLNDKSFLFIASQGHVQEFKHILTTRSSRAHLITPQAKETAFKEIVNLDHPPEMILALLKDGECDVNMPLAFSADRIGNIEAGRVLH
jgi:hypothetical protein